MRSLRLFAAIIVLLLIADLSPLSPISVPTLHQAHAATQTVSLIGYYNVGWNNTPANPTITITEGDTLVITTSSGDTFQHHFFVDVDKDMSMIPDCSVDKCASVIPPTHTDTLTGFTRGTYTYYCQYHVAMKGTFIVQPPPPDFKITANPSSLSINQAAWKTSTLNITSLYGFSGTVTLTPTAPTGITPTLNSSTVTVAAGASRFVALNVTIGMSTTPGSYTVSVMASGGGNTHTADVGVTVIGPDFTISLDQTSLSMTQGSMGNVTVTLTSQNGFSGTVALTATVSPSGPTLSFTSTMLSLASGGSATSKLVVATTSASAGTYTVTVTGTGNPSLSHSATKSFTLTSPASPAAPIPTYVLIIAGVAILAAIVAVAIIVLRRPRK